MAVKNITEYPKGSGHTGYLVDTCFDKGKEHSEYNAETDHCRDRSEKIGYCSIHSGEIPEGSCRSSQDHYHAKQHRHDPSPQILRKLLLRDIYAAGTHNGSCDHIKLIITESRVYPRNNKILSHLSVCPKRYCLRHPVCQSTACKQ